MACYTNNTNNNNTTTPSPATTSYILDAVTKIDQLQKEATMQSLCEGCDATLMTQIYNTKPVTFYLCNGTTFSAVIPNTTTTSNVFRIEDVRKNAVVLRIIDSSTNDATCTNYTVVFDLNCACALQCFQPICCERCTGACSGANN